MNLKGFVPIVSVAALFASAALVFAQGLGEVAKKEEQRRKAIAAPAKVYTNKDLNAAPEPSTPPATTPTTPAATPATPPTSDAAKAAESKDKPQVKDQAYWAARRKTLQEQLGRDETFAEALQSRLSALNADFVNRDDPAQRNIIERDRQKALGELNRLKLEIEKDKKALADLDEEARRAGVPPGWLR